METAMDSSPEKRKRKRKGKGKQNPKKKNEEKEKESHDLLHLLSQWQTLSTDLLQSILDRISSSIPDLLSFSAVCTSWRSLAKSSPISLPPLLLSSVSDERNPNPKRSSMSLLKTLTPNLDPRTFRSRITKTALNRHCCGCSYGHLIFADTCKHPVLVADLFSTSKFRLPRPPEGPPQGDSSICGGFLTAPPSSSSCMLILIRNPHILCWRLGSNLSKNNGVDWLVIEQPRVNGNFQYVYSVCFFNSMLHIMYKVGAVFMLEFVPHACWKRLPNVPPCMNTTPSTYMRLAECDGNLLLVCFRMDISSTYRVEVYRMDLGEGVWVRFESIGNWCLFMDFAGRCPLACRNPGKWGGESNCIYFGGPSTQFRSWTMLPLDGTEIQLRFMFMPFYYAQWPYPAWVYPPSMLL